MSTTYVRTVNGNTIYAALADADSAGNSITTTYATKSEVGQVRQVPASTSSDEDKVLTVNSSGTPEWVTPAATTVDQSYNASSTNAQSGTAVAQAIAAIPEAPTYSAGDAIAISAQNAISVKYDSDTLDLAASSQTAYITEVIPGAYMQILTGSDVANMISSLNNGGPGISVHIPGNTLYCQRYNSGIAYPIYIAFGIGLDYSNMSNQLVCKVPVTETDKWIDEQTIVLPPLSSSSSWIVGSNVTSSSQFNTFQVVTIDESSATVPDYSFMVPWDGSGVLNPPITFTQSGAPELTVANPLPSSAVVDEGKVLTVNLSGAPSWAHLPSVDEVPAVTSADGDKLLKATYSGGTGSYAWATVAIPTIGTITINDPEDNQNNGGGDGGNGGDGDVTIDDGEYTDEIE